MPRRLSFAHAIKTHFALSRAVVSFLLAVTADGWLILFEVGSTVSRGVVVNDIANFLDTPVGQEHLQSEKVEVFFAPTGSLVSLPWGTKERLYHKMMELQEKCQRLSACVALPFIEKDWPNLCKKMRLHESMGQSPNTLRRRRPDRICTKSALRCGRSS